MERGIAVALGRLLARLRFAGVAILLALQLSGCLTADGVLRPDGTATLTLAWAAAPGTAEATQRAKVTAEGITIESLSIARDRKVTAVLRVADLAAIGKTELLQGTTVTAGTDGDAKTLTITAVVKPLPREPEESVPGPSIRLTLPGAVLDATEAGEVDGASVQWAFRLRQWLKRPEWRLHVRYRPAEAAVRPDPPAAKPH